MKDPIRAKLHADLAFGQQEPPVADDDNQPYHILVVDDEADHCLLLERFVLACGYECASAGGGQEALDYLTDHPIDLVITDLVMPGIDGMGLLRTVKSRWPGTKVLVITGYSKDYSFKEVIQAGASDFMEKPVSKDMLAARIERIFYESLLLDATTSELKTKDVLLELLKLSNSQKPLDQLLHDFLHCITALPWMELERKGAILLVDEHEPNTLVMAAHQNLASPQHDACTRVAFGTCLCGLTAERREIVFADHVDAAHSNALPGFADHGHYCIPILLTDNTLLGVLTLFVKQGTKRRPAVELTLMAAAQTVAGIIAGKHNEAVVAENERRVRAITDSTLDAIVMMDGQGAISFWNPAAERIFGYSAAEVMGRPLHELLVPEYYQPLYAPALQSYLATGSGPYIGKTMEVNAMAKDGRPLPIELSLSSLRLKDEWQAVATVRDITERKRLEQEQERLNVQLRQAQKMEAIGTLAGGIAHDFNNILGAIIGFADVARDEVAEESLIHEDLERILAAGNRAKDLVGQILTFSRQREEERVPVKIQFILKEAVKLLRATIPANIEIAQRIDTGTDSVLADPTEIHQVVMNLCTNAYYAMRGKKGRLTIGLGNVNVGGRPEDMGLGLGKGKYVRLTVADTGAGMSREVMEHIFEPYYTTKPQGEGTGLGLSLVHGIVEGYGGVIQAASEPDRGTSFDIYIPALTTEAAVAEAGSARPMPTAGAHEHILLVDDEVALVDITSRQLRKLGYEVTTKTSSIEALEVFKHRPQAFDLIVTDLTMPQMTGPDMVRAMRQTRSDLPSILTTGFAEAGTPDYADTVGVDRVISKPINLYELALAIRQVLTGDAI